MVNESEILNPNSILNAYRVGIFPMADDKLSNNIYWVKPRYRGVLPLNSAHIPKSLKKKIKKNPFVIKFDTNFSKVIKACSEINNKRDKTWINKDIIISYNKLFDMGYAHSVEAWKNNKLVGGLYGISINSAFFGESMFSNESDSSKISLIYLIHVLKKLNFILFDVQFRTDHLSQFGVIEIHENEYDFILQKALSKKNFYSPPISSVDADKVLQSITQTS
ncbi:MAG: Leucyl/phenylalanyl-tRNA--protein transferase [Alphaproteobacteria bacterium MarineAlpha2_Bin1]|nr:MAG: Leucyl/phenylalanyl-tRNA--protein transferase [Alphaproteobacteria bacterium MarineAlpha2_Bin1]